jgi:hypothetical protein
MATPQRSRGRSSRRAVVRVARAWRALAPEQRFAGLAALALWLTMLLPWYSKTVVVSVKNTQQPASYTLSAFGAFSFVEAAVLLVSVAVLAMLFARGERRAFHLPGGDGFVVLLAGAWIAALVFYRMLDKPGTSGTARFTTTVGIEWGIFFALFAAIALAYAGVRLRASHRPEPSLAEDPTVQWTTPPTTPRRPRSAGERQALETVSVAPAGRAGAQRTPAREDAEQLSFELPSERRSGPFGEQ